MFIQVISYLVSAKCLFGIACIRHFHVGITRDIDQMNNLASLLLRPSRVVAYTGIGHGPS